MAEMEATMGQAGDNGQGQKSGRFLGSLRDALAAAGREENMPAAAAKAEPPAQKPVAAAAPATPPPLPAAAAQAPVPAAPPAPRKEPSGLSAAEAAREAKGPPMKPADRHLEAEAPPTTRVLRGAAARAGDGPARTQLVRGKMQVKRGEFHQDPVVGWVVVVGGAGLGSFRPVFEGNNTIGRSSSQRIPIDFGDDAISSEEQAYIRYDSADRTFLFVPNLAKTNVVQVNDKKPTSAVPLSPMDVITVGRTQLVFVPFCSADFDWSELSDQKD